MLDKSTLIDKTTPIPLYYQLKTIILDEINAGNYKTDDPIPTEKEFSELYGLSRTTVRQAIIELVHEGWLYRIKSKGTFVSRPKLKQDFLNKLESFHDQITRIGKLPRTEVLGFDVIDPDPLQASHLKLQKGEKAIQLFRKRYADEEPIVTINTLLPYSKCSFILEGHDLVTERLYDILSCSHETAIVKVNRVIDAVEATSEDAALLDYKKGKPIQLFKSTGYNADDIPIEYSVAHYRGDKSSFEVFVFNVDQTI